MPKSTTGPNYLERMDGRTDGRMEGRTDGRTHPKCRKTSFLKNLPPTALIWCNEILVKFLGVNFESGLWIYCMYMPVDFFRIHDMHISKQHCKNIFELKDF